MVLGILWAPPRKKIRTENQHSNSVFCHQTGLSEFHGLIFSPRDIRVPGALSDGSYSIAHWLLCKIAFLFYVHSRNTNKLVARVGDIVTKCAASATRAARTTSSTVVGCAWMTCASSCGRIPLCMT